MSLVAEAKSNGVKESMVARDHFQGIVQSYNFWMCHPKL